MPTYVDQVYVVGSTVDFTAYAVKDGEVWDITGASVELHLRSPAGVWADALEAEVSDGEAGVAHYAGDGTELSSSGWWSLQWRFVLGGIDLRSDEIKFRVAPFRGR